MADEIDEVMKSLENKNSKEKIIQIYIGLRVVISEDEAKYPLNLIEKIVRARFKKTCPICGGNGFTEKFSKKCGYCKGQGYISAVEMEAEAEKLK